MVPSKVTAEDMAFERRERARPAKGVPPDCGTPPDQHCSVCSRFAKVSPDLSSAFAERVRPVHYAAGDEISTAPGFEGGVSVLTSGAVMQSQVLEDGRRQVTGFVYPGEALALGGVFSVKGFATALSACDVYEMAPRELASFLDEFPAAWPVLSDIAGINANRLLGQIVLLGRMHAIERVAAFLVDFAKRAGTPGRDGIILSLPMDRVEIADHLGMNPETVSRQLARLKSDGLVLVERPSRLIVPDLQALNALIPEIAVQTAAK